MASKDTEYWSEVSTHLDNNSMEQYNPIYERFKFNHMSHGIYALYKLEYPMEQIECFIKSLAGRLESATENKEREKNQELRPSDITHLKGQKQSFYYISRYFEDLLHNKYGGSIEKMVGEEFHALSQKLASSGVHGPIHLGYGIAAGKAWMVCEALAYLFYSNVQVELPESVPASNTLGHGTLEIIDVIQKIRADDKLIIFMDSETSDKHSSMYGNKSRALCKKAEDIYKYVHLIEFPEDFKARNLTLEKIPQLSKWLIDCAIIVYAVSKKPNDFFLLHGVTLAWSLSNVLPLLRSKEHVLEVVRSFLGGLLVVYLAEGYPELNLQLLKENDGMSHNWKDIVKRAIYNEDFEEHIYKLVQVCWDMSKEFPNSDMESLYRLAAHHCVSQPLTFTPS